MLSLIRGNCFVGGDMNSVEQLTEVWRKHLKQFVFARTVNRTVVKSGRTADFPPDHMTERFAKDGISIELSTEAEAILGKARAITVLVSSRWGHDPENHWLFGRFLMRSMQRAVGRHDVLLVASASAIEPWAVRAAQLTDAMLLRVGFDQPASDGVTDIQVHSGSRDSIQRDEGIIMMADRIDASYVRRGGRIEHDLNRCMKQRSSVDVHVAITNLADCAAKRLVERGANGCLFPRLFDSGTEGDSWPDSAPVQQLAPVQALVHVQSSCTGCSQVNPADSCQSGDANNNWFEEEGEWLVHCTRASRGKWPDETIAQYRDTVLTGNRDVAKRTALDSLCRIVHTSQILASAIVSARKYPVVCWSALPLLELLQERCFRKHLQRWDYEPYGVAVRRRAISKLGAQPVIYGQKKERDEIPENERYRFQAAGKSVDWTREREWRLAGNLSLQALNPRDVRIFSLDSAATRVRLKGIPWELTRLKKLETSWSDHSPSVGLSEIWKAV